MAWEREGVSAAAGWGVGEAVGRAEAVGPRENTKIPGVRTAGERTWAL